MKQFTKEQLNVLSQWEDRLYSAYNSKFYRNISSKSLDTIKGVYEEASGEPVNANWSCNHCILAFLAEVGKKYFEDCKAYELKAAQMASAIDAVFNEVPDEPKKSTTKPKATKQPRKRTK